jgi:hypothetical protein
MKYDRTTPVVVTACQEDLKIIEAARNDQRLDVETRMELAKALGSFTALLLIHEELYHRYWEGEYERNC